MDLEAAFDVIGYAIQMTEQNSEGDYFSIEI